MILIAVVVMVFSLSKPRASGDDPCLRQRVQPGCA